MSGESENQSIVANRPTRAGWSWIRIGQINWQVNAAWATPALLQRLERPESLLTPPAEPFRPESPERVTQVVRLTLSEFPADPLVVKRYRPTFVQAIKDLFRASRTRRAFDVAWSLQQLELPAAVPVAAGERRRGGWLLESYFICLEVRAAPVFSHARDLNGPGSQTRRLVRRLGRLLGRLHNAGLEHTDLRQSNVLVCGAAGPDPELVLIDLDAVRVFRHTSARATRRSLANLFQRIPLTPREQLWMVAEYARVRQPSLEARALTRALGVRVQLRETRWPQ